MSCWAPTAAPSIVSISQTITEDPDTILDEAVIANLEAAIKKRTDEVKHAAAPVPMGKILSRFRSAARCDPATVLPDAMDEDEEMEELEDVLGDEMSDGDGHMETDDADIHIGHVDDHDTASQEDDDEEDDDDDDDDDDDNLDSFL